MYDFLIIGAGIIGSSVARELSKYQARIIVIDKENDVANVQTSANSAIVHSGYSDNPGTLKAKLSVKGNKMYEELEEELRLPLLKTGAYVVAHNKTEENQLLELYDNCKRNQVPKFEIIDGDEARKNDPNLSDSISKVLSLPTTKVTYPWEVAFAAMEVAIQNGVDLVLNSKVIQIEKKHDFFVVKTQKGIEYHTRNIVNSAGVESDDITKLIEGNSPFTIKGRKGEYFVLDKRTKGFMNHVIYPLPSEQGKGVLITPQYHGETLLGPNSEYVDNKYHAVTSFNGLQYVKKHVVDLAKNIPFNQIIRSFAGIRSTSDYEDFYIKESKKTSRFFIIGGIESPGLTACFAIAEYLVNDVINMGNLYEKKDNFIKSRVEKIKFNELSIEEKKDLIKKDARYGKIICKCEKITEKEIIDAINGPLGSKTIKGIKKRTRSGAGLCQGGYCEEKIVKILINNFGLKPLDILYDKEESNLFVSETKVEV